MLFSRYFILLICLALGAAPPSCTTTIAGQARGVDQQQVGQVLRELANAPPGEYERIFAELRQQPEEAVKSGLLAALANDPSFRGGSLRRASYESLFQIGGLMDDAVFERILMGVREPEPVRQYCLAVLGSTPLEKQQHMVEVLGPMVLERRLQGHSVARALDLLARSGQEAAPFRDEFSRMYHDARQIDVVRESAALAMICSGGLGWALGEFRIDRPADAQAAHLRPVLQALNRGCGIRGVKRAESEIDCYPGATDAERVALQAFVLEALRHPDARARHEAIGLLLPAWGDALLVPDASQQFRFDPVVEAALLRIRSGDSDDKLRAIARELMDDWLPISTALHPF
jgi:hypothetical protein